MSLFTCRTCTDPEYSDTPDSTARLALGGVHSVKESVYAPYRRIFLEQETTGPSQWALSDGVNARIANHRKYRPCVLQESVKARRPRRSAPYIYLMATYKGNNVSDLPWFFRFFSFPVSPNLLLHDMNLDGTHFHTTPEWPDGKPQWLIIIPIRTTKIHPRTPPWPASRNLQTVRYAFGPKALDHIASLWGSRSLEWQTMCEDPDFLPRQAALLNDHEAEERAKDRSAVTSYGDEVSVNTMGTSKWSTHTMHVPPSDMMAIPEGETLDEVTGDDTAPVPGKMDGPMLQTERERAPLRTSTLTNTSGGADPASPYARNIASPRKSIGSLERDPAVGIPRTPTDDSSRSRGGGVWRDAKAVIARAVPAALRKSSKDST